MKPSPEALYAQLGQLVAEMPDLATVEITAEVNQWLGRAYAYVQQSGDLSDAISFKVAADNLNSRSIRPTNAQTIAAVVHRALAKAELEAPAGAKGSFVNAGGSFDAFSAIGKVLARATKDVLIVDPYADGKALTDFAAQTTVGVGIRILTDEVAHKATLKPAVQAWIQQYATTRPLMVRLAAEKSLHDRLFLIDGKEAWSLTQSLNAFAARSPASIVRVDAEMAAMKFAAYEPMWQVAKAI